MVNDATYYILHELGRGASARILSGFCVENSQLVAIKIFSPHSSQDLNFCEHEQRVLEHLVGKQHCIQLIDASIPRGIIVIERGEATLSTLLTSERIGRCLLVILLLSLGDLRFIAYFFPQVSC